MQCCVANNAKIGLDFGTIFQCPRAKRIALRKAVTNKLHTNTLSDMICPLNLNSTHQYILIKKKTIHQTYIQEVGSKVQWLIFIIFFNFPFKICHPFWCWHAIYSQIRHRTIQNFTFLGKTFISGIFSNFPIAPFSYHGTLNWGLMFGLLAQRG